MVTDFDYRVTGDLNPDATGNYLEHIMHNGKMSYRRDDGAYYIWWDGAILWYITTVLGVSAGGNWGLVSPNIVGDYTPNPPYTGIATVS